VGPRRITLVEYQTTPGVRLSAVERDALRSLVPSVAVSPTPGRRGAYDLTPGSWIGVARLGDPRGGRLVLEIRPKLPIGQVLFLLAYALDPDRWEDTPVDFPPDAPLLEAVVPAYLALVRRATARGLLHGYRPHEDALPTLRGRLRPAAQARRHWGRFPPVEVAYDDFTADGEENRVLKAALQRLRRLPLLTPAAAGALGAALVRFDPVPDVVYRPESLPAIRYTRLNAHYRPAVELARRLLGATAFDLGSGDVTGTAFLVDMNVVFEDFVCAALRRALSLSSAVFPQGAAGKELLLDRAGAVRLRPDLSWWEGDRCVFVGDVKYKRTRAPGVEHPDLYQLLAYAVATGLPAGLLIYAAGEAGPAVHGVDGRELQVTALDLAGPPEAVLGQVRTLAGRVRRLRRRGLRPPAEGRTITPT
jgi:5-methylcytosine-specific restriction enzyme subunit McrC